MEPLQEQLKFIRVKDDLARLEVARDIGFIATDLRNRARALDEDASRLQPEKLVVPDGYLFNVVPLNKEVPMIVEVEGTFYGQKGWARVTPDDDRYQKAVIRQPDMSVTFEGGVIEIEKDNDGSRIWVSNTSDTARILYGEGIKIRLKTIR